ncbi:MAG TPA: hypothetical protein VK179_03825 [Bacteroidales bacterium]|nr:hypothetical protein [Bacteroidales bacterium]
MRSALYMLLLAFTLCFSCNKSEKIEYNKDGTISKKTIYTSDDRKNYRQVEYRQGKAISAIREFTNGIPDGRNFDYYPNGNIKTVFYYDMGRLNSIARSYDEQGLLTDKGLFINDSLVVKEEYFYKDDLTKVNIFSKNTGTFQEAGTLLYNKSGQAGLTNSLYFIIASSDSIPVGDSLNVLVNFIAHKEKGSRIAITLGQLDEKLAFLTKEKTFISDSLSLSFRFKPKKKGYNLILGKLLYTTAKPEAQVREYVFYHDFLAY